MNKMADVAKLLGVEMEKEFIAKYPKGKEVICILHQRYLLTNNVDDKEELWGANSSILCDLITGNCEIYKLPWKAELNEEYYMPVPANPGRYQLMTNNGSKQDDIWYKDGLMCKTKEQAIEIAEAMIKVAREMQGFDDEEQHNDA